MTLREIVERYIAFYRAEAREEMRFFKEESSLADAIRRAALCEWGENRKRHPHQRRILKAVLEEAERRLQASAKRLARAADFAALHRIVQDEIGSIPGIGGLTVYDVSHRIGAYVGKEPALVYLHAGTKAGAAVLGFNGDFISPRDLPAAFARLTPAEIEDCLCIYKEELRGKSTRPSSLFACLRA